MSRPETTEDLEFNLFYQAIQTRFLQQYEHAQQNCWLVCIPRATSLTGCSLTRSFVGKSISQDHQLQTTTSAFDQ
ncbi:hypothetical protein GBAR_LOCUS8098 [Geodia barretti]|uniref:Uncharacterized protein n=1 Tax=Geodia barretti TaxID=519541 RepID=A0AA35RK72_GEOBA|nr:hypothetical protein GBAR_LOCUS8098 [Geodia barretti]